MGVANRGSVDSYRPLAVELGIVIVVLVVVHLWQQLARSVGHSVSGILPSIAAFGGLLVIGMATTGLFLVGLGVVAGTYATLRDIDIGLTLPGQSDIRLIGMAGLLPIVLVGGTKIVGTATGVTYSSLVGMGVGDKFASNPTVSMLLFVAIHGPALLGMVVSLVLICQVFVQESFNRVLDGDSAVVVTVLVTGYLIDEFMAGSVDWAPDKDKLLGALLFIAVVGVVLWETEHVTSQRLRYLAALPVALFVVLVLVSGLLGIESIAEGCFILTHFVILGIAAYTYERSNSVLVPALSYLSFALASLTIIIGLEAGVALPV